MKLGTLLDVLDENKNVVVVDNVTDETLARYDGKNTIDTTLNTLEVKSLCVNVDTFIVYVGEEEKNDFLIHVVRKER